MNASESAPAQAATVNKSSTLFLSPRAGTAVVDSIFDVSIFIDTRDNAVNALELKIKFSPDKLTLVKPSGGKSFIAIWPEPPSYSNTEGTARFVGGVPNGINTQSGLITTLTFKAKEPGQAVIEILPSSKVLANDGLGTNILSDVGRGVYIINPKPPEGVKVFSETHPFEYQWYNNGNPILNWEKERDVTDFSLELNHDPWTTPDNLSDTANTTKAYENLGDGIWYFHIKAKKDGMWGSTTHFALRVDTAPPEHFIPKIEMMTAAIVNRSLVSFSTKDLLSGIDHYEVGIIDKSISPNESPFFTEAESPYQLPYLTAGDLRIIVRAIDRAGNVRDEYTDAQSPLGFLSYLKNHIALVVTALSAFSLLFLIILHYLYGHKIIARLKEVARIIRGRGRV